LKKFKEKKYHTHQRKLMELVELSKIIGEKSSEEAAQTDSVDAFPAETLKKIKSAGLLTACINRKYGGQNLGLESGTNAALLTILRNIGRGNLVMGRILEGHMNAQILIREFGNKKQQKIFAKDAFDGRLFGVWNTQADDGTYISQKSKKKKAKHASDEFILKGSKTFATGTGYVSRPLVTAAMEDGSWQMCMVPLEKISSVSDASWWNPMGMKSSRSFKITFLNAPVSKINLIGSGGDYYRQPDFGGGAIRFAAVQLGAAEKLLEETRKYLKELNRINDPFQNTRIGEMAIAVQSGNQWMISAAKMIDNHMGSSAQVTTEQLVTYANMMRTAIEQICILVMNHCMKCIGARGLNKPYHFERMIRDLNTYLRQPAPDAVLAGVGEYVVKSDRLAAEMWL
jgi:alkylation response protein AidB-like acyl-CoA dehydrogenase